jgi:hypothetical protein
LTEPDILQLIHSGPEVDWLVKIDPHTIQDEDQFQQLVSVLVRVSSGLTPEYLWRNISLLAWLFKALAIPVSEAGKLQLCRATMITLCNVLAAWFWAAGVSSTLLESALKTHFPDTLEAFSAFLHSAEDDATSMFFVPPDAFVVFPFPTLIDTTLKAPRPVSLWGWKTLDEINYTLNVREKQLDSQTNAAQSVLILIFFLCHNSRNLRVLCIQLNVQISLNLRMWKRYFNQARKSTNAIDSFRRR